MKTFGQFFDELAGHLRVSGSLVYSMKHEWVRSKTAEKWQEERDQPLTYEAFGAFMVWAHQRLGMIAAFTPSDSAFEEEKAQTDNFIDAAMHIAGRGGLDIKIDWKQARVPDSPVLAQMSRDMREQAKPYSCTVYRVAKAVDSSLPDIFVEVWSSPDRKKPRGGFPPIESIGTVGGDTPDEVAEKLAVLLKENKVQAVASWPGMRKVRRIAQPA